MTGNYSGLQIAIFWTFTTCLVPVAAGWFKEQYAHPVMRNIFYLSLLSFVLDGTSSILWLYKIPNLFLGHIYTVIEFLCIANAYRLVFIKRIPSVLFASGMGAFVLLALLNALFFQQLDNNNAYIKGFEALLLMFLALGYFFLTAKDEGLVHLGKKPLFWLSTGVLIYFSVNAFLFVLSNSILNYAKETLIFLWFLHALFFVLFNLFMAKALWISPKK